MNTLFYTEHLHCKCHAFKEPIFIFCVFLWPDRTLQGTVPPAEDFLRDQQGEELHRGGRPIPHLHAAQAGFRQGERLRRAAPVYSQLASVPLRLVPEVSHGYGE